MQTDFNDGHQELYIDNMRPKSGKTARVWAVADELTKKLGRLAGRKDVMQTYAAEGGNPNTASTQYSKWKAANKKNNAPQNKIQKPGNIGSVRLTVGRDGRLHIPAELRSAMMLDETGSVTARVVDGELRVLSQACTIELLQNLIARSDKGHGSVVDELVRERRADAKREEQA